MITTKSTLSGKPRRILAYGESQLTTTAIRLAGKAETIQYGASIPLHPGNVGLNDSAEFSEQMDEMPYRDHSEEQVRVQSAAHGVVALERYSYHRFFSMVSL